MFWEKYFPRQQNRKTLYRILNAPGELVKGLIFQLISFFKNSLELISVLIAYQKKFIFETVQIAQVLKNLLEVPIFDKNTGFRRRKQEALEPAKLLIQ